jgi:hypothetical protein
MFTKMTTWGRFLFLVLAWTIISAIASGAQLPVVHVTNALPVKSEPVKVECTSEHTNTHLGIHTLNVGDDYQWTVVENALHYCQAEWGRWFASWHAFEPDRDVSHGTVYWLVKNDGFYLSWDNSSWVRQETWQTD